MSMNIKNAETEQLTRELAGLTGESLTSALTTAVRERLDRVRRQQPGDDVEARTRRILAIGQDIAPRLVEPWRSREHGDLLYDDQGLPG